MRFLPLIVISLAVLLSNGTSEPSYALVCEDVLGDGSRADVECHALVAAVRGGMVDGESVNQAAVWAYIGCPPGAYCGLRADPQPSPPVSALIGVRAAKGLASIWFVHDVTTRPLAPTIIHGYDPNDFIDGLARSIAATRAP